MFSEFFLQSGLRVGAVAWCGLLTVVGYALFMETTCGNYTVVCMPQNALQGGAKYRT